MFLKTESFEYNGVSVTLSELSALQRIEHLALLKRQAEQAGSSLNRQVSVEAREMGRPDWRAMLAGMSSTEYADWHRFYSTHYFHDVLLDMHFSGLTYTVLSLFFSDPDMHPLDFSLLNRREADEEPEDDVLMQKAAGLAGGVRFGPDGNEVIPASPDVADMTEDDVMLMTVSEGIAGGVRYG
ncbi:phage tail assembly protein T [Escherichia coli]|nr:phage tail assembly protein T [Escherichia coli]